MAGVVRSGVVQAVRDVEDYPFLPGTSNGKVPFGQWTAGRPNAVVDPDPLSTLGTRTAAGGFPVVPGAAVDRVGERMAVDSPELDWFDKVHILPRVEIEFGNIITQQDEDYEVYSAWRHEDVTLSNVTNNATPGVELPDLTVPTALRRMESLLDPSTTGNSGLVLGTIVPLRVVALTNGLPVFDTSIDFDFSVGGQLQLLVSGSRIVLMPFEYEAPVETLAFLTDIISALDGHEQRIALRKNPRQMFEVLYLLTENDRQRMQALLMDWSGNVFGFPLYHEAVQLSAAVSPGATSYPITGGDDVDFRAGGLAVAFTDVNTFDVIQISAASDTSITAADPSVFGYAAGTLVMPLRTARIVRAVAGGRAANNLERFKVIFEVTDNDTGALAGSTTPGFWSLYDGRVLFDDCNVVGGEMREEYRRRIHVIDNATGIVNVSSSWDRGKRASEKSFTLRNRADIKAFRQVMRAIRGRQKAFWLPTFFDDVTVKAALVTGTRTFDIERIEYERFVQSRSPKSIFRITFNNGDPELIRTVVSATGVDATTERLTFDAGEAAWPSNVPVDEIERVEFFELSRFDSDNVPIRYAHAGLARVSMPVLQVFDDD